jgi:integrase
MKQSRLPKYVTEFKDRHGKWRTRFRRKGQKTHYFKSPTGSPAWHEEYRAILNDEPLPTQKTQNVPSGSFSALIALYLQSPKFKGLRPQTQRSYLGVLRRFESMKLKEGSTPLGTKRVAKLERQHVIVILGKMEDRKHAANNLLKRLRTLMEFALDIGWIEKDPTLRVKGYRTRSEGHPPWTEDEVVQFENKFPVGTKERLALDLLLYTGQRMGDVIKLGRQHLQNGYIVFRQNKTDAPLKIPVVEPLQKSLDTIPAGQMTFLVTAKGTPFAEGSYGNWFRGAVKAAGITNRSSHGLRKVAARRLAEEGLSNASIKAITGHKSDSEVKRYVESANQSKLATAAMKKLYGNKSEQNNG